MQKKDIYDSLPSSYSRENENIRGCVLRHTLSGHKSFVMLLEWSPDGSILASGSFDHTIRLWNVHTGTHTRTLSGHLDSIRNLTWSPDGHKLASSSEDGGIYIWDIHTGRGKSLTTAYDKKDIVKILSWSSNGGTLAYSLQSDTITFWDTQTEHIRDILHTDKSEIFKLASWSPNGNLLATCTNRGSLHVWDAYTGECQPFPSRRVYSNAIKSLAWSPDGHMLAVGANDGSIYVWYVNTGVIRYTFSGHTSAVKSLAWSPNGYVLASGSYDRTIRLWNIQTGQLTNILEGHTDTVESLQFFSEGYFLASTSPSAIGREVYIWYTDTLETVTLINLAGNAPIAFHPTEAILALPGIKYPEARIWDLDLTKLLSAPEVQNRVHYANAKVVLVGDSGVGKSGLGLALSGEAFTPTESSHGRRVWTFDTREVHDEGRQKERREILLWDLAGQPGYRLIHQLHLDEVAIALVVFDARSETDPFAGVQHWERALRQARTVQGDTSLPLKKFLVAARTDRGGIGVSAERIESLVKDLGFDGYFETSAKEGMQISDVQNVIRKSINWKQLPKVSSTALFQEIKNFLVEQKKVGQLLPTVDSLYRLFLSSNNAPLETVRLQAQFETCIGRVESTGFIKQLSFGNLVLLQPELLDAYASALINAVKSEPDGLGTIAEEQARRGNFKLPADERISDQKQEQLLLIAMIEDLLRREIVLREGEYLVFPSQSTRENPDLFNSDRKTVVFEFEGPILNIYTTLVVRLSQSDVFRKTELWKNAALYIANVGGMCGVVLHNKGEGCGELALCFDEKANEQTRFHFEEFVHMHLQRKALLTSIQRRRIFVCSSCGLILTEQYVEMMKLRHNTSVLCPIPDCQQPISLLDREARLDVVPTSLVSQSEHAANEQRDRETTKSIIQGKEITNDFDVLLFYHPNDSNAVKAIGEQLKHHGILPWLDQWEVPPGQPKYVQLEQQIERVKSVAVFFGNSDISPRQRQEIAISLQEFVKRSCPIIPVLLPNTLLDPKIPPFLNGMRYVDFRKQDTDAFKQLIWGITGIRVDV